jgi:hypothetical protein
MQNPPVRVRQLMTATDQPAGQLDLLLGGALTTYLSWRWVLFINVPIAVGVLAGTGVRISGDRERGRLDVSGAITAPLGTDPRRECAASHRATAASPSARLTPACRLATRSDWPRWQPSPRP